VNAAFAGSFPPELVAMENRCCANTPPKFRLHQVEGSIFRSRQGIGDHGLAIATDFHL
jgi:hypothetical protein